MPDDASDNAAGAAADTTVNSQVVDAVNFLNEVVRGAAGGAATGEIAYQVVAHAAALAVQDAVDYQRNALSICAAAQGKALAMMLEDPAKIEQWTVVYTLALSGSAAASLTAGEIGKQATLILDNFPRESSRSADA